MAHNTTWEERGIYWKFSGHVSAVEVEEADNEMYGDPRFDEIKYFIWDMTDASELGMTESDSDFPAGTDRAAAYTNKNLNGALVSNNEQIRKRFKRYIEVSSEIGNPWKLKIFNNLEDARAWVLL